jgi:hypothetical protein
MANFSGWKLISEINVGVFVCGLIAEQLISKIGS